MNTVGTNDLDEILRAEHDSINRRRDKLGRPKVKEAHSADQDSLPAYDTVGLALSGGGIRSAAFSLGVLQAFHKFRMLPNIDYISTVSGGGYIGASLSATMTATHGEFVFADQTGYYAKQHSRLSAVGHLRNHSNDLLAGNSGVTAAVAIVIRGPVANLLFLSACASLNSGVTVIAYGLHVLPGSFFYTTVVFSTISWGFVLWAILISFTSRESARLAHVFAASLSVLLIVFFVELQGQLIGALLDGRPSFFASLAKAIGIGSVVGVPALICLALFQRRLGGILKRRERGASDVGTVVKASGTRLLIWLAAAELPLYIWWYILALSISGIVVSFSLSPDVRVPSWVLWISDYFPPPAFAWLFLIEGVICLLIFALLKPNALSLHGPYRDRLNSAFIFDPNKYSNAGYVPLSEMRVSDISPEYALYHLINAALNIRGSSYANQRGRDADFFCFSPLYVGSVVTGYVPMSEFEKAQERFYLATAMAISGAAISSSMGTRTIRPLTPTLALFNIRLGYWLRNPKYLHASQTLLERAFAAVSRSINSFLSEIVGRLYTDTSKEVYVTDGGHIENLGLYELLRRHCHLIICVDGESDPDMRFSSFITLQRYAWIDMAIDIRMPWEKIQTKTIECMGYDPLGKTSPKLTPSTGPHAAIGVIHYSVGKTGILVYIKSSLSGDEQDYVRDYARRYMEFPHESTGKQFFNEEQFEVYRALGFHIAEGLLSGRDDIEVPPGLAKLDDSANPLITNLRHALGFTDRE